MAYTKPRSNSQGTADTTGELAQLGGRPGYTVLVKDVGIFEWTTTGPENGTDVFAGKEGFWSMVSKSDAGGSSYLVYTAKINMATGAATVFQNTLGATPTWATSAGSLNTVIVALIGQTNVYVSVSSASSSAAPKIVSGYFSPSPWTVRINQTDNAGVNDSTQEVFVEIRVYP